MNGYRLAVVVALVAVGLTFVSVGAVAIGESSLSVSQDEETDSSMGDEIGAFMQSSTAEADGSIDRGMFEASLDETDDPDAAVRERIDDLEGRYAELANRSAALETNSSLPEPARRAQLTRLAVQLDDLDTSINETEHHARAVGVDTDRLDQLRHDASELSGPEIAEIAKGLAGVEPPGQGDGHPSNNNPGNGSPGKDGDNQGNGNPGAGGDNPGNGNPGNGNPGNGGDNPGNGSPGGPPDDPGPPGDDGSDES